MPSIPDYAQLALRVYPDHDANRLSIPAGWRLVRQATGSLGFAGAIYLNTNTNEVVVSYTGTNDVIDNLTNFSFGVGLALGQLRPALALYQEAKALFPTNSISFTGHSLGGGLASMMAVFFNKSATNFAEAPFEPAVRHQFDPSFLPASFIAARIAAMLALSATPLYAARRFLGTTDLDFNAHFDDATDSVFLQREQRVTDFFVQGEFVSLIRSPGTAIYGADIERPIGSTPLGIVSRHSMKLHAAVEAVDAFRQAAIRLPSLLPAMFDSALFAADTAHAKPDLLAHLLLHQFGTRTQEDSGEVVETRAPDFMLERFASDLLKLANRGVEGQYAGLAKGLTELALQRYYEFASTFLPSGFSMFDVITGGLKFDMSQIAGGKLAGVKGYNNWISALLGLDTNRGLPRPAPALPSIANWYVQVGAADGGRLDATGTGAAELFWGGSGIDQITGGAGADVLVGGQGADTYTYNPGDGADTVYDLDGQISIGGSFVLNGGVASVLPRTWRDDEHNISYKMGGRDLVISGDGLGGGENTITLKGFIPGDLGIELRREPKVAVSEGTQRNVFQEIGYTASNFATSLAEGAAKIFTIALNSAAQAGERLLLSIPGGGIVLAKLKAILGSEEASFADGTVEVALSEGQSQVTIALVEEGDVDTDQALTFTATLQSDDPDFTPIASNTVTINFDARDEGADPVTTHDIFGDRVPEEETVNGSPRIKLDQWGNPVTTDEVVPGQFDFRFDTPFNDNIQVGAADRSGPGEDYVRAFRGGDDVIEQSGPGRMWAHGGDGNDVMVGGVGSGVDPFLLELRQDMLNGGAGDDRIYGETRISVEDAIEAGRTEAASSNPFEGDFLSGNAGDDLLIAGTDRDLLAGGGGKDVLVARAGDDVIFGDADYSAADVRELGYAGWGYAGMYWVEGGTPENFTITVHNTHPGAVDDPADSDADTIYAGNGDDLVLAGGGDDAVYGDAGDDRLFGEGGSDFLLGGAGNDLLVGEATSAPVAEQGSDFLDGGDGDDRLLGGGASDALYGGAGDDEISGDSADQNAGDDYIDGEAGDDLLVGAGGADEIYGGEGDDTIGGDASNTDSAAHGDDYIDAEAGDDLVVGGGGADTIFGGAGDDHLEGDGDESDENVQGGDYLDGEAGDDEIIGGGGADTIFGGEGDDHLFGEGADDPEDTAGDDYIDGEAGDDLLVGGAGGDHLVGGEGKDQLFGESADPDEEQGDDLLDGGEGDDLLNGGGGADTLIGGDGADTLFGDAADTADEDMGDDTLDGGAGDDILAGAGGSDTLDGGEGDDFLDGDGANIDPSLHGGDFLTGGEGIDQLIGGGGDDTLDGGEGDDVLQGGDGDDTLEGGDGDDILTGGTGSNVLSGGAGDDFYFFRRGDGFQRIIDPDGVDVLYVEPGLTIFDLQFSLGSLRITDGVAGDEIHIEGFDPNDPLGTLAIEQIVFLQDGSSYDLAQLILDQGFDITGTPGSDFLEGTGLDDRINGLEDDDMIVAGAGHDTIDAGEGDDIVDAGEGFDTVTAGDGDDVVFGGGWSDTIDGGAGDDLLLGEADSDELIGGEGSDTLDGGASADSLDGGAGADIMSGGDGDDTYYLDDAADAVIENPDEGTDSVVAPFSYTLGDDVEQLWLVGNEEFLVGTGNDAVNLLQANEQGSTLLGLGDNDRLFGAGANDTLDGGSGADQLEGRFGDDFYVVDDEGDTVIEHDDWSRDEDGNVVIFGGGWDFVSSSVSYVLANFVEGLQLEGSEPLAGYGNVFENELYGNQGDNLLVAHRLDGEMTNLVPLLPGELHITGPLSSGAAERLWDRALHRYYIGEVTGDDIEFGDTIEVGARFGDYLSGGAGDDVLLGSWDHDYLVGDEGDDILVGSGGEDTMLGGAGDDIYVVDDFFSESHGFANSARIVYEDNSRDVLLENPDEGSDTVWSLANWFLDENFENLVLIDSGVAIEGVTPGDGLIGAHELAVVGEGNEVANEITGNSRANELYGYEGDDVLRGGRGGDYLDGGEGADTMYGGVHDDTYWVDQAGDLVIETGNGFTFNGFDSDPDGFADWVISYIDYTLPDFVENLELNGEDAFVGTGNELDNVILGNDNDNQLTGLDGHDSIDGGAGNDLLTGGAGNDVLQGGEDDDAMTGGTGDDIYYVDSLGDTTAEEADEGHDTVYSSHSTTLGPNLEDLYLLGEDDLEGIGNELDNRIVGNSGANLLLGLGGDDTIEGNAGSDFIEGAAGADVLSGGDDDDELYGGDGSDSLDGGSGADYLEGGAGDETYFVDDFSDQLVENFDQGTDSVFESLWFYQTPNNVENATILGDFQDDPEYAELYGNALHNRLTGSDAQNFIYDSQGGNDVIDGRAGGDSLYGWAGADEIYGGDDAIRVETQYFRFDKDDGEWEETDSEDPGAVQMEIELLADNNDYLNGDAGADDLDGGSGDDTLEGGGGDDVLYGGDDGLTADRFASDGGEGEGDGGEGGDSVDFSEPVFLGNEDFISGGAGDDVIDGGSDDDRLFGGDGADTLYGGAEGPLNTDNRDYLDGGAGIDYMAGGTQDDQYIVDGFFVQTIGTIIDDCGDPIPNSVIRVWTTDTVFENADEGYDTVRSRADFTLPENVEDLFLEWFSDARFGGGNSGDNFIFGNNFGNRLEGGEGNDRLFGEEGDDVLDGGGGDDFLQGWTGNDSFLLRLGSGQDVVSSFGGGFDSVHVLDDLTAADITLSRSGDDVLIGLNGTHDRMTLINWFGSSERVREITFCDDASLDEAAIEALANQRTIEAGDDFAAVGEDAVLVATGNVLGNDASSAAGATIQVVDPGFYTGSYGSLVLALNGDYAYTLNNDAVQWLAEGESAEDVFGYSVEDDGQAFGRASLIVTIAGANDAPVMAAGATGAVTEDAGEMVVIDDGVSLLENGGFESGGFDGWQLAGNTQFAEVEFGFDFPEGLFAGRFGAVGSPTLLSQDIDTDEGQRYLLRFYLDKGFDGDDNGNTEFSLRWNGETLTSLADVDLDGFTFFEFAVLGEDTSQLEFSLRHDPDYWRLDQIELTTVLFDEFIVNDVQVADGTLQFTDVDLSDAHFVDVTAQSDDYLGEFVAFLENDSTWSGNGSVAWFFQVFNDQLNTLAEGDTLTQSYDVTVGDDFGGSATQTVTVLIHGANDAPEAFDIDASVVEDLATVAAGNALEDGAFDPDQGTVLSVTNAGTYLGEWGTLELHADGSYTYTLDNDAVQFLAQDQFLEEAFEYQISDNAALNPLSAAATLFVGIHGTNDAPITVADFADVVEDAVFTASGNVLDNDSDIDEGDTPVVSTPGSFAGLYGTLTLAENGAFEYVLENDLEAVQRLHAGEVLIDGFEYQASDGIAGTPGSLSVRITGANDAPLANADSVEVREDILLSASGNALANDFDRDHDTVLHVADPGSRTGAYGKLQLAADGSFTYTLKNKLVDFLPEGAIVVDTFAYTASDRDPLDPLSASSSITVAIVGSNDAPVTVKDTANVSENGVLTAIGNVLDNDSDPDSGTTLSVANAGTYVGRYGTLVLEPDGAYTYELGDDSTLVQMLRAGQTVSEVFAYAASDGMAQTTGTLTVKIGGANDGPAASDDSASVQEDLASVASGNVLANDTDGDLGTLLVVSTPGTYEGLHGTLTLTAQGSYTYTLDNAAAQSLDDGDSLTDFFAYTASDSLSESTATLTVTINGLNDAPNALADFDDVGEDAILVATGNVLANDSDVDAGDVLSAIVPGIHAGAYGSLTLEADGDYVYTLANDAPVVQALRHGQTVQDVFAYAADDGEGGTLSTLTVRVAGANDAPTVANPIEDQDATAGSPFEFTFEAGTFADIDQGDVLSYTAALVDGSALPDWLSFNQDPARPRTFTGTPPSGEHCEGGTDSLQIRVLATDRAGASTFEDFTLMVAGGGGGGGMTIIGTDNNDVLVGTPCDDVIDGRKGFDIMRGGDGDDIYYVDKTCKPKHGHKGNEGVGNGEDPPPPGHDDNQNDGPGTSPSHPGSQGGNDHGDDDDDDDHDHDDDDDDDDDDHHGTRCKVDQVIENAGEGYDIVYASADYALPDNVEELRLLGSADLDGTGNGLDNVIVGNTGDNRLKGGRGADVYVHELNGGDDVIEETGPESDTLLFGEGITAQMVKLERRRDDLVVDLSGPHGSVTVKGWFDSSSKRVERIQFADGTAWNVQDIKDKARRSFEPDCGPQRDDRDRDDRWNPRGGHDPDSKDRQDDERRRDRVADGIRDRLSGAPRFDFEELHGLLGKEGRALSKGEIGARWRAVADYAQTLGGQDDGREGAWQPGAHGGLSAGLAAYGAARFGFEGSTGAPRGQDNLKTLEGLIEGFRKL